jgi:NAD(P)H-dependent FMN reductase
MTVFAFSGSPRPGSSVSHLLKAAIAALPAEVGIIVYEEILSLPLFSPDLDEPGMATSPTVMALRQQIKTADAVIIATPEYAYGMPGSLKNALDWLVSAGSFYGKPTAVLSASPSEAGGERARSGLLLTLTALGVIAVPTASFPVPFVRTKIDATGAVLDPVFAMQLVAAMAALVQASAVR